MRGQRSWKKKKVSKQPITSSQMLNVSIQAIGHSELYLKCYFTHRLLFLNDGNFMARWACFGGEKTGSWCLCKNLFTNVLGKCGAGGSTQTIPDSQQFQSNSTKYEHILCNMKNLKIAFLHNCSVCTHTHTLKWANQFQPLPTLPMSMTQGTLQAGLAERAAKLNIGASCSPSMTRLHQA